MSSEDNSLNSFYSIIHDIIDNKAAQAAESAQRMDSFDFRGAGRGPLSGNKAAGINMYYSLENRVGGAGPTKGTP